MIAADDHQKFWTRVNKTETCWLWIGSLDRAGYGKFTAHPEGRRKGYLAHRWSYEEVHGPIPSGLQIDHLCRVTGCVRPDHLEAVTPQINVLRSTNPAAANARKTHCIRGHELTPENLYGKRRNCRTCKNLYSAAWKRKYRAAHPVGFATGRCKSGLHDITTPGAIETFGGKGRCVQCARQRSREYQARKREARNV